MQFLFTGNKPKDAQINLKLTRENMYAMHKYSA